MTTESLGTPHATMSHPWGTSAIVGVVHGVMGVQQTAAAWSSFTVQPRLGSLRFANATVPTIRGPIVVAAAPGRLEVQVPCNTQAKLCLPRDTGGEKAGPGAARRGTGLLLDGVRVRAAVSDTHLCATAPVGCARSARVLEVASV